jgi:hypothetical protein
MEALGARLELRIVSDEFNVPLHLFPSTHEMLWGDQLPMLRPSAAVVPFFSLLVIRVIDVNEVRKFYEVAGLRFISERHGTGPEHYAASNFGQTFEIYPAKTASDVTNNVRLGFLVSSLAETAHSLKMHYPDLTGNQQDSGYGRFVSAKDPAGTKVDFYENASGSDQTQLAVAN